MVDLCTNKCAMSDEMVMSIGTRRMSINIMPVIGTSSEHLAVRLSGRATLLAGVQPVGQTGTGVLVLARTACSAALQSGRTNFRSVVRSGEEDAKRRLSGARLHGS